VDHIAGALIANTDPDLEQQQFQQARAAEEAATGGSSGGHGGGMVSAMSLLSPVCKGRLLVGQQLPGKPAYTARWHRSHGQKMKSGWLARWRHLRCRREPV